MIEAARPLMNSKHAVPKIDNVEANQRTFKIEQIIKGWRKKKKKWNIENERET